MNMLTFGLLFLTVTSLWLPKVKGNRVWPYGVVLTLLMGFINQQLSFLAVVSILALIGLLLLFKKLESHRLFQVVVGAFTMTLSVLLAMHLIPGFSNMAILQQVQISDDGIPFTLWLNIDKTLVGICIIGITLELTTRVKQLGFIIKQILPIALGTILVTLCASYLFGYVRFEPKLSEHLALWALVNLVLVCTAQEAIFRGFLQKNLAHWFAGFKGGKTLALMIAALAFGLVHHHGGYKYILLSSVAGLGYGLAYQKTSRLEASILAHFSLNVVHITLFSYPALQSAFV